MLIAEELLLLLLNDRTGRTPASVTELDKGLAGAVLVELALLGSVDVAGDGGPVRKGRLVTKPAPPPEHPVLADALEKVAAKAGRKPQDVLGVLAKGLKDRLTGGLVEAGLVRKEARRVLGLFPTTRLPAQDIARKTQVRERLREVLAGAEPDERSGALIAVLSALNAVTIVVDMPDKRAARRRAKEIAQGHWAAAAVRKAVDAVNAAIMVAITSSAAVGGDGGSS
jgi:hypothetical protein